MGRVLPFSDDDGTQQEPPPAVSSIEHYGRDLVRIVRKLAALIAADDTVAVVTLEMWTDRLLARGRAATAPARRFVTPGLLGAPVVMAKAHLRGTPMTRQDFAAMVREDPRWRELVDGGILRIVPCQPHACGLTTCPGWRAVLDVTALHASIDHRHHASGKG
jgi:hypothetical protein